MAFEVRRHCATDFSRIEVLGAFDGEPPEGAGQIGLDQPLPDARHPAFLGENRCAGRGGREHAVPIERGGGLQDGVVGSPVLMQIRVDRESFFGVADRRLEQCLPGNAAAAELLECNLGSPNEGGNEDGRVSEEDVARSGAGEHIHPRLRAGPVEKWQARRPPAHTPWPARHRPPIRRRGRSQHLPPPPRAPGRPRSDSAWPWIPLDQAWR